VTDELAVSHELLLSLADGPITGRVTKFGGQPEWVEDPAWPLSTELGTPMRFIGQVTVPRTEGAPERMAYVFMTQDDEEDADGTWEPEGGENAVICQPGRGPSFVETTALAEGPTVGPDVQVAMVATDDAAASGHHLGGEPAWLQPDETPPGFTFLFQLDSTDLPFWVNFGDAGLGYAFVDHATGEGRFLWQGC
jgi:uncharacterized protein YwqG